MLHRLLPIVLAAVAAVPARAGAQPSGVALRTPASRIGGYLGPMLQARARGDVATFQQQAGNGHAKFDGDLLEVQLHLRPGLDADMVLPEAELAAWGGRGGARGLDLMDVWLPLHQIERFVQAHAEIAFAQLPWRPLVTVGAAMSEGAQRLRSDPGVACLAADGTGTTVAVLDAGFTDLDKSKAKGELPNLGPAVQQAGGHHGTMCAEVVADVAPGAKIVTVMGGSFAAAQQFVKSLSKGGNPQGIDIVSHSVIWMGMSFGRHSGPACTLTDLARSAGVAWVNASGNSGNGQFHAGVWTDSDGDGLHEFLPGVEQLQFQQHGGGLQIVFDWDDYEKRASDIDLVLVRKEGEVWKVVDESRLQQNGFVPTVEAVTLDPAPVGTYALRLEAKNKVKPGMRLRILSHGYGTGSFAIWHKNGNVYDPGSCDGVLTVGALHHGAYDKGPLEAYSSYGPTPDGRQKPEIVAPTGVSTTYGPFYGTSAACPHAAGALAVYAAATGKPPLDLVDQLIADAQQMGEALPDDAYGWGRVEVRPPSLGWQCDGAVSPALEGTCTTACGTTGRKVCDAACRYGACQNPAESCNGEDDDCNGIADDGLPCALGVEVTCATACGSTGNQVCGSTCTWGSCVSPAESCNGKDDDCDGQKDEGGVCTTADVTGGDGVGSEPERAPVSGCGAGPQGSGVGAGLPWGSLGLCVVALVATRWRRRRTCV